MRRIILGLALALAGCGNGGAVVSPQPPFPTNPCDENLCIFTSPTPKLDVLFVVDDGPTMGDTLATWRASLQGMLASLNAQLGPAHYHFGAITSDLGAGPSAVPSLGCVPGGDGAILRSDAAIAGGARFVDFDAATGTANVADVAAALQAITDVGTSGCAIASPLEAAYQALRNSSQNAGFLRADAFVAVVFVTDSDDCSVPPTSQLFAASSGEPLTRFRCTQHGIACNGAPVPAAGVSGLTGCESQTMALGGALFDVSRYNDFFTLPAAEGGVKVDPDDVALIAIAGPSDPVGVTIASPCADDPSAASCATLQPSCIAPNDLHAFGAPAVRLDEAVRASHNNWTASICSSDDSEAMQHIVPPGQGGIDPGCLRAPVALLADGAPDCAVTNMIVHPDGSQSTTAVPSCAQDPSALPCWRLVDDLPTYDSEGCAPPGQPTCRLPAECQPVVNPTDGMRELFTVTIDWGTSERSAEVTSVVQCATTPTS